MNKAELISAVAEKTGLSKKDTEKVITATVDAITAELIAGEKVDDPVFTGLDQCTKDTADTCIQK